MAGHNLIKMTDISALFVKMGFKDASTYIQSGNILFTNNGDRPTAELSYNIEKALLERFKLDISVMTRTVDEIKTLFNSNPFLTITGFDPAKNAVIFLHDTPREDQILKMAEIDSPPTSLKSQATKFLYIAQMVLEKPGYIPIFSNERWALPVLQETGRRSPLF